MCPNLSTSSPENCGYAPLSLYILQDDETGFMELSQGGNETMRVKCLFECKFMLHILHRLSSSGQIQSLELKEVGILNSCCVPGPGSSLLYTLCQAILQLAHLQDEEMKAQRRVKRSIEARCI